MPADFLKRAGSVGMLVVSGFFSLPVRSQDADSLPPGNREIKAELLREVTIRYFNALNDRSIVPSQSLKGKALRHLNSLSVADAVRYFSGVQLKDYGGIGGLKTIDTRSMGTNHTAVFYDGIQLGNAQNGQVDLGRFSLDNIEEINLYNAQRSELLQPARAFASAASIYLQPKIPAFTQGRNHTLGLTFRTGSFGLVNPSLLYEQRISKKLSASLSSEWVRAHGRYSFRYTNGVYDTTATRENADIDGRRIEAALYHTGTDSSRWTLRIYSYHSERGLPGAVVANKFQRGQRQWDDNSFIQASYRSAPSKRYQYQLNAKFAYDHLRYLDPDYVTENGMLDNRYRQQEAYLSFSNSYELLRGWQIAAAADVQWNKLDANIYRFSYPMRTQALGSLTTQVAIRKFRAQGGLLQTGVWERAQMYENPADRSETTPFISASWHPFGGNDFKLRGFYKKIFRLPGFNDLYYTFVGNTSLRPEFATQYNAGFSWVKQFPRAVRYFSLTADAYYNDVTDKIVAVPTTNLYRWMMLNLGSVDIRGLDAALETSFDVDAVMLTAGLKYTYQNARDITPDAPNYGQQIPYVPLHNGSLILQSGWRSVYVNYSFIYSGERYSQKMNIPVNHLQPWYTHDVSVSKTFALGGAQWRALLEVNNVLNQHYDVVINFPMPGRYYRLSLNVRM